MSFTENSINKTEISELLIPGHKYSVKLATSKKEIEKALKLRFNVFNIELKEGLDESYKSLKDEDEYDSQCHHLIVIENNSQEVIGTYRMQNNKMATLANGFYSSSEFNIYSLPRNIKKNMVELGRACIHQKHRNGRVLYLLWKGLARYLLIFEKRYFIGCCSINSQNTLEGIAFYQFLKENELIHDSIFVNVKKGYECLSSTANDSFNKTIKLPQLFQLYMKIGAKVCSPPAIDRLFKTIDFLILFDKNLLSDESKSLFMK
jgi:putative hemolysin